eukprot:Em0685g3a
MHRGSSDDENLELEIGSQVNDLSKEKPFTVKCAGTGHNVCTAAKNEAKARIRANPGVPRDCHKHIKDLTTCRRLTNAMTAVTR